MFAPLQLVLQFDEANIYRLIASLLPTAALASNSPPTPVGVVHGIFNFMHVSPYQLFMICLVIGIESRRHPNEHLDLGVNILSW